MNKSHKIEDEDTEGAKRLMSALVCMLPESHERLKISGAECHPAKQATANKPRLKPQ